MSKSPWTFVLITLLLELLFKNSVNPIASLRKRDAFSIALFIYVFSIGQAIQGQIPDIQPLVPYLDSVIEHTTNDAERFEALVDLTIIKTDALFGQPPSGDDPTTPVQPLLKSIEELGGRLGEPYQTRAEIMDLKVNARMCYDHLPERRGLLAPEYKRLSDKIGFGTDPQTLDLRLDLFVAMSRQCKRDWYQDSTTVVTERLYNTPELSDSQRIVLSLFMILDNIGYGDRQRGRQIIQESLDAAENMESGYLAKARLYFMIADFFEKFTGEYERAEKLLLKSQRNALLAGQQYYDRIIKAILPTRINNYKLQGNAEKALELLDSLEILPTTGETEIGNIKDRLYNSSIRLGLCRMQRDSNCLDALQTVENLIPAVITEEEPLPRIGFLAGSELGLYYHMLGQLEKARPKFDFAYDVMNVIRFEDPDLKVDMLRAYSETLDNSNSLAKNLQVNKYLVKALDYILDTEKNNSSSKEAFALSVSQTKLEKEQAEEAARIADLSAAASRKNLLIGALTAAFILAIIAWAYLRSRRDAQKIADQKAIVDQSLTEKEVLLREIHHRVKNNLQIISSLLQKQARRSDNEDLQTMIRDGQERIQSMALIHENLYRSEQLSGVSIRKYLEDLTDNVSQGQGTDKVAVELEVSDERLDLDTAIPLGLILNELITNAYKYAFPDDRQGKILVEFEKRADGNHLLRVSDDGVGLPTDHELRQRNSLGLNLVKGLVGQLEGTIEWAKRQSGTSVAIQF